MVWSLFPKLFRELSVPQLANLVREVGLDTTNAVVREGYWVEPDAIANQLPAFVQGMAHEGIRVTRASTLLSCSQLADPGFPLRAFPDCGVTEIRIGWFPRASHGARAALDNARRDLATATVAAEKVGLKLIVQLHHRTLITSPTAAWWLVDGLDPKAVGVELDPGNQIAEGFEPWDYACDLLGPYVSWIGAKDAVLEPAGEGRSYHFVPAPGGLTDWRDLSAALTANRFDGTVVLMPFYDEADLPTCVRNLKSEVAYLRQTLPS